MSENVGAIYYTVEAETAKLIGELGSVLKGLDSLGVGFNKTDKSARQTEMRLTKVAGAVQGLGRSSSAASQALRGLLPVLSGAALVKLAQDIIATADAWTQLQNRLRLVTDGTKELAQATEAVFNISQSTSQEIDTVAQVYQRFAQNASRLGLSLNDVAEVTDVVAKAVAISGASAEAASAALTQFGQGLASGTLRGEELNSVMEQTPALAQAIATGLGVSIGQLRQLGQDGKITAGELIKALKAAGDSVNEQFDTRVKTAAQAWTELRNSVTRFVGELSGATNMSNSLADSIERVSKAIDEADLDSLAQEIEGIKGTISLVVDGVEELSAVFKRHFPDMAGTAERSFTQMALTTAKEVDSMVAASRGAAGAIGSLWDALAHNIPTLFKNAWNIVKRDTADTVNALADMLNKPLQAVGLEGFSKVTFGAQEVESLIDLTDALKSGWDNAAIGAGAYERTLKRVTDNAIDSSINDWMEQYSESTEKAVTATTKLDESIKKKKKSLSDAEKAAQQNKKVIDDLATSLYLAGLKGEELAAAKAKMALNPAATEDEVLAAEALARALWNVEEAERQRGKFGEKPKDADQYIMGNTSPLSGGAFDDQYARYEAEAEAEQKRYDDQLERLRQARELQIETKRSYDELEQEAAKQHADRMAQIEQAKNHVMLASASDAFGALAGVMKQSQGEQSGIYKAMFAASKAFAIADATVNAYSAISKAWNSAPFPANLGAVAATTPQVMSVVSAISGASYSGRQYGGPTQPGKMYRINENGAPEVFNAANGQQFMLPNTRGHVVSNKDASVSKGGEGAPRITLNLIEDASRAGQVDQQQLNDEHILNVCVASIRGGTQMAGAIEGTYGVRRQGR